VRKSKEGSQQLRAYLNILSKEQENEMDRSCSMHGEMIRAYKTFLFFSVVEKYDGKTPFRSRRRAMDDNTERD
jgi:hypothetical protein